MFCVSCSLATKVRSFASFSNSDQSTLFSVIEESLHYCSNLWHIVGSSSMLNKLWLYHQSMLQIELSEAMTHSSNHNMQFDLLWLRVESTGYVKCILLKIQITISQLSVCMPPHQLWVWPLAEILWIQYLIWKFLKIGTTIHSDPLMSYKNIFGQNFIELICLTWQIMTKKSEKTTNSWVLLILNCSWMP